MWKLTSLIIIVVLFSCTDPGAEVEGVPTGTEQEYDAWSIFNEQIGIVTVQELDNGSFSLKVELSIPFTKPISVELVGDNSLDGNTSIGTFGTIDSNSTEGEFSRPGGVQVSYAQLLDFDGHIGFYTGSTKSAFADVGDNVYTDEIIEYTMFKRTDDEVFGMAYFRNRINDEGVVIIDLNGTLEGDNHPAHIHRNTNALGGGIVIDLNYVAGQTGMSMTNVVKANDGARLDFDILSGYDGYITVHKSDDQFGTYIAQGDIGQNKFTGRSIEYEAISISSHGVSGTITFSERLSGNTLVKIALENDNEGVNHPAHIHAETAVQGGDIVVTLNDIVAGEDFTITEVTKRDDGAPITFEELLDFDGFVNIHHSTAEISTFITQADIGQNALTGQKEEYVVTQLDGSGMSGTIVFEERVNEETLVTMTLTGFSSTGHATHIHSGSVSGNGGILINLRNVNGTTGISASNITQQNDGQNITYSEFIEFDGHVVIHDGPTGGTKIASGNIGSNG